MIKQKDRYTRLSNDDSNEFGIESKPKTKKLALKYKILILGLLFTLGITAIVGVVFVATQLFTK